MADVDPIVELIDHEVGKLGTMLAFKVSAINDSSNVPAQKNRDAQTRSYRHEYQNLVRGLKFLKDEYSGKMYRKEVHKWALLLHGDARRMLWQDWRPENAGKRKAYSDVSKAIIDAFKQL